MPDGAKKGITVKVIIHKLQPEDIESFECDEDCVNCPFRIIDCAHEKAV